MITKVPHELEVGDYFSYPGSFKVYMVQTPPEIDPIFEEETMCTTCESTYIPRSRLVFEVTDGNDRDHMGIRLRSDVVCTLYRTSGPDPCPFT